MKKFIAYILTIITLFSFSACGRITFGDDESDIEEYEYEDESGDISKDPDRELLLKKYPFLRSKYTVTATKESSGMLYVYNYHFVKGVVAGATLVTSFSDVSSAKDYYKVAYDKDSDVTIDGVSVIHYITEDDLNYFEYSLEKLKFVLSKTGYEVVVNFDEVKYNEKYADSKDNGDD
ncbi:MAG: hypothetical protein IKC39_01520 [Clostridia bacterium]|nr:hypothetical protein [Clostridia bacterium]